jgi:hypothetical protein
LICGAFVVVWLKIAITTKAAPPPGANNPSQGWKMNIPNKNNGVHYISKSAIKMGDA